MRGPLGSVPRQSGPRKRGKTLDGRSLASSLLTLLLAGIGWAATDGDASARVVDPAGKPLAGVEVVSLSLGPEYGCVNARAGSLGNLPLAAAIAWSPETHPGLTQLDLTTTDDDGGFALASEVTEPNSMALLLRKSGFAPSVAVRAPDESAPLQLQPGYPLAVELLDENDQPLDGEVRVIPLSLCGALLEAFHQAVILHADTDVHGIARFEHVPIGVYALRLTAPDRRSTVVAPVIAGPGRSRYRARLEPGASIRGTVTPSDSSRRGEARVLALWHDDLGMISWATGRVVGKEWEIRGLPRRPTQVRVVAKTVAGWASRTVSVSSSEADEPRLRLDLQPPVDWQGRVDATLGAKRLLVTPGSHEPSPLDPEIGALDVEIGSDGTFQLASIPANVRSLELIAPGIGSAEVPLEGRSSSDLGTIRFTARVTHKGRMAWTDGQPADGLPLVIVSPRGPRCLTRTTQSGEFACSQNDDFVEPLRYFARVGTSLVEFVEDDTGSPRSLRPAAPEVLSVDVVWEESDDPVSLLAVTIPDPVDRHAFVHAPAGRLSLRHRGSLTTAKIRVGFAESTPSERTSVARKDRLELSKLHTLHGLVVDDDGRPVPEALVELRPLSAERRLSPLTRIAGVTPSGEWRFGELVEGRHELVAEAPGYSKVERATIAPTPGSLRIVLSLPAIVRGSVLGLPVDAQAQVRLTPRVPADKISMLKAEVQDGRFEIDPVAPGDYVFQVLAETAVEGSWRKVHRELRVLPGQVHYVDLNVGDGILLSGSAFLGEKVLTDANLGFTTLEPDGSSAWARAGTDSEGHYSVLLERAGSYEVRLIKREERLIGQSRLVVEVGGESPQERDLTFESGSLCGRVIDKTGRPVEAATVSLHGGRQEDEPPQPGMVGPWEYLAESPRENGAEFCFPGLAANDYLLRVRSPGLASREVGPVRVEENEDVEIPDVVLEQEIALRVAVLDPEGRPLDRAMIVALQDNVWTRVQPPQAASGSDGVAVLSGLAPGNYTVAGFRPDLPPALLEGIVVRAEDPGPAPTLRFRRGGSLHVQVLDSRGHPLPGQVPRLVDGSGREVTLLYHNLTLMSGGRYRTNEAGQLLLDAVLPGPLTVGLSPPSTAETVSTWIREGTETSVVIYAD